MEAREALRRLRQALRPGGPGKIEELAAVLNRFGAAIEADFARYYPNDDPAALWRARRWRRLLNLINRLPSASHFAEAQANDEELARAYLARPGANDEPNGQPRVAEWDPIRAELTNLVDRVGELIALTIAAHGGDKVDMPRRPRPHTAVDRLRSQQRLERHAALVERMVRRPRPN